VDAVGNLLETEEQLVYHEGRCFEHGQRRVLGEWPAVGPPPADVPPSVIDKVLEAPVVQARDVDHPTSMDLALGCRKDGGMDAEAGSLEVVVEPRSGDFSADAPGWRAQVVALRTALREADLDEVRRREIPSPGHKAGVEELVIALGTSGAITAAVEVIRAWLSRDRTRHLQLSYRDGDQKVVVEVDGGTVSDQAVSSALNAALEHLPKHG